MEKSGERQPNIDSRPGFISDPDFICNVITALMGLNRSGERKRLEDALHALSRVFYYLSASWNPPSAEEELSFLKAFLSLRSLLSGLPIRFAVDFPPDSFSLDRFTLFDILAQRFIEIDHTIGRVPLRVSLRCIDSDSLQISVSAGGRCFRDTVAMRKTKSNMVR
jgi:hypothetical protein